MEKSLLEETRDLVVACARRNIIPPQGLYLVVTEIGALLQTRLGASAPAPVPTKPKPAVPIKHSVKTDYIVCLEDGKRFLTLKRHLHEKHNLSPDEYRDKWGLPDDYPVTCSTFKQERSRLALKHGLGRRPRRKRSKT